MPTVEYRMFLIRERMLYDLGTLLIKDDQRSGSGLMVTDKFARQIREAQDDVGKLLCDGHSGARYTLEFLPLFFSREWTLRLGAVVSHREGCVS